MVRYMQDQIKRSMGQIAQLRKKFLNNYQTGAKVMNIQVGWFKVAIPLTLPFKRGVAVHLNLNPLY